MSLLPPRSPTHYPPFSHPPYPLPLPDPTFHVQPSSSGISLSAVWSAVVTLLSLSFLSTLISSTARSYLVLHHQRELDKLIREHRERQGVPLAMMQGQGGSADEDSQSSCVEDSAG